MDISTLQAKDQITNRVIELFVATDARDWPRVQACFYETVYFDQTSVAGGDPGEVTSATIIKGWDERLKPLKALHHQVGNLQIIVNGSEATAHCYGIAYHYLPNPTGKETRAFVGSYELKLRQIDDDWKINAFTFRLKFIDGNKELEKTA